MSCLLFLNSITNNRIVTQSTISDNVGRIGNPGVDLFSCELPFNWYLLSQPLLCLSYLPRRYHNFILLMYRIYVFSRPCIEFTYFCTFFFFSFTICFLAHHFSCICPDVFLTSVCSSVILSSSSIDYGNGWLIYSLWDKFNNSNSNNNNDNIKFP